MSNSLFQDFDAVSAKQWKQKIQFDLKGADYNDTLIWQSLEGIHVKPFYHSDDTKTTTQSIPGQPEDWKIAQHVFIDDPEVARQLAQNAINRGAESIYFAASKAFDISVVFHDLPIGDITLHFDLSFLLVDFLTELQSFLNKNKAQAYFHIDLLGNLARTGNWFQNQLEDHNILETLTTSITSNHLLGIDMSLYQNAGANMVQQLSYALAHCNEYLNHLGSKEALSDQKSAAPTFKVAVGSNYFFEIAKIRALRVLYASLATEYGLNPNCHIMAVPSKRNKTLYDYNLNMLRTTTECMSAVLGGADTVCNLPYDAIYHKSNEFGERISRNQLLILKAESYFDVVSNPSDGAYYIESLTRELAEKALELFKDIEKNGGFLQQLKAGIIQKKIKESAQKEQDLFDKGSLTLVGTNKYLNKADKMKNELELYPFLKLNPRQTAIAPILEKRLSEKTEQQRLENE